MRRPAALLILLALASVIVPAARSVHAQATPLPADDPAFPARVDSLFEPWRGTDRPGCAVGVSHRGRVVLERGYGMADLESGTPMTPATVVHAASLAKQVTALAVLLLVRDGRLALDDDVRKYLPELPDYGARYGTPITVRHLLTHTSGLPAFKPYDRQTHDPDSLATLLFTTPLDSAPGRRMVYSDIGAYHAGLIVERVSGQSLDRYLEERVFHPLDMRETMYRPPRELLARIAPTEIDTLRGGKVRGAVHDERAYYLGGVSAHAGLFGSARDLARFAQMYLNGGTLGGVRVFRPETIELFTTRQVADRALGWQKPSGTNAAGHLMSERAFGHTGFTGTSIWMDPAHDIYVILLSNRVNPTRANTRISGVRVALADAVIATVARAGAATTPEPARQ